MSHVFEDSSDRFVLFPIKYPTLYAFYEKHVACFWTVKEVDLSQDDKGWERLDDNERAFILQTLAFFAASDGIVIENLMLNFMSEVTIPECRAFYGFQFAMENVHSEQYSLLIEKFAENESAKQKLFKSIENHSTTKAKADWTLKMMKRSDYLTKNIDFCIRLIAFAACEGIFFSASFASIFWLKNKDTPMPGLNMSNELISRDEGLHRDFACELYKEFPPLPTDTVYSIIDSAVDLEKAFVDEILPERLKGMNSTNMKEYVEYVADHLIRQLGCENLYNTRLPASFKFMEMISLTAKTNFFERRVSEYSKCDVGCENTSFDSNSSF